MNQPHDETDNQTVPEHESGMATDGYGHTWIESGRPVARTIGQPIRHFLHIEAAAGIVLLAATIAALILANTAVGPDIAEFWHRHLVLFEFGDFRLEESLAHWVNDGLMVIFFFVVGLEIKSELVNGELRDPRKAAVPAIAAIGGMVIPAGIYLVLNLGTELSHGWGIPMATDIAFAVSVLAMLGSRIPGPLKVFLLTLAIVDDIGAILVIAVFYTETINFKWLALAAVTIGIVIALRLARIWYTPIYLAVGIITWVAFLESGVHATIAGVILGLIAPAKPLRPQPTDVVVDTDTSWNTLRSVMFEVKETVPVADRLEQLIHPWSAFVILPIFAFSNAGIELSGEAIRDAATSPVSLGVTLGLVLGKPIGVLLATFLAVKSGLGSLPSGTNWRHIIGAGALAGIGFTVALFVAGLAFKDPAIIDLSKIGILAASMISAAFGSLLLISACQQPTPTKT